MQQAQLPSPAPEGRFQLLSLDGGGLGGLFTARFPAEWEQHVGRPITSLFDPIAGTGTGGIIALAPGAGYSAPEVVEFHRDGGSAIFPAEALESVGPIRQAVGSRYKPEPLESVLEECFGDQLPGEGSTRLVIPAYHAERGIYIFKTSRHCRLPVDRKERMAVVARATGAAPTHLPPLEPERGLRLIDGGVWANNPARTAINEEPGCLSAPKHEIAVVGVGTTTGVPSVTGHPRDPGGVGPRQVQWFVNLRCAASPKRPAAGHSTSSGQNAFSRSPRLLREATIALTGSLKYFAAWPERNSVERLPIWKSGDGFCAHIAAPFTPYINVRGK